MINNKTLIITGAAGNLGSYFTKKFISSNNLILIDNKIPENMNELTQNNINVEYIKNDITDFEKLNENINYVIARRNWKPQILLHTAAIRSSDFKPLAETDPVFWKKIIETNLIGTYHILKSVIPIFQKNKFGRILLLGSNVSRIGLKFGSAYAASKAGIANLARSIAKEIATDNILINTISPGPIKMENPDFSPEYRNFREKYYENEKQNIPLNRIAEPNDLFYLCEFLLSEKNTYLTGEEIFVTGGKL